MQSRQVAFWVHATEYVSFLVAALLVWSYVTFVHFLISGRRPTLKEYLVVAGCFSVCWSLASLPFRSISKSFRQEDGAISGDNGSFVETSTTSREALEEAT